MERNVSYNRRVVVWRCSSSIGNARQFADLRKGVADVVGGTFRVVFAASNGLVDDRRDHGAETRANDVDPIMRQRRSAGERAAGPSDLAGFIEPPVTLPPIRTVLLTTTRPILRVRARPRWRAHRWRPR